MTQNSAESKPRRRRRFVVQPRYQIQFAVLLVIFQFNVGIIYQGIMQMRVRQLAEEAGSMRNFIQLNLWNEALPWMLGVSAAVSVFVYLIGLFFSNTIVGPIPRLRDALHKIAKGDFSPRLRFRPGDALEDLAEDVNHLAASLDAKYGAGSASAPAEEKKASDAPAPEPVTSDA